MTDPKIVFAALPHVDKIWITEDGNFHLHPNNGGKIIERNSFVNDAKVEINETETELKPRPRGRQKQN